MLSQLDPSTIAQLVASNGYDYLDFGCGEGDSLEYGKQALGGTHGLGLDIKPDKVRETLDRGYDAIVADVTLLEQTTNIVRFVTLCHFLEHLPGFNAAKSCLTAAISAAADFVLVRQPWFDSDGYLFEKGLKLYWSDWHGHPYTMSILDLHKIISRNPKVRNWEIYGHHQIGHSQDPALHPLSSPIDQHVYDPTVHLPKPQISLLEPIFYEVVILIQTGECDISQLRTIVGSDRLIYASQSSTCHSPQPRSTLSNLLRKLGLRLSRI